MITYFLHSEINKRKWDDCISASVNGRIYAYSWYLDLVADAWDALILDDYEAVFPLPFRAKFGIKYIYQPVFTQQLGLFSKKPISSTFLENFLVHIPKEYNYVSLNLNQHNRFFSTVIPSLKRNNIEMDLISDYTDIKQKYSSNLIRNLKKAANAKLTIFENLKPDAVVKLFQEHKGKELGVYSAAEYSILLRLIYKAIQLGHAEVWGAYNSDNSLCAAAVFFKSHRRITFLFSGNSDYGLKNGALPYLLDAYLEANSSSEKIFDFEGSNNLSLARFYLGFGAQIIHYYQLDWLRTPFYLKPLLSAYLQLR